MRAISPSIPSRLALKASPPAAMVFSMTAMSGVVSPFVNPETTKSRTQNDDVGSMFRPEDLSRLGWRGDLPPGAARAGSQRLDQLPVRCDLGAVVEIERIFQSGAQMAAEIGAALVQRPDFGASDRGHLPMRIRRLELEQDRQQFR